MMDNTENTSTYNNNCYNMECCHCKKIFMALVVLILTFMAGIMVGNCGRCHYSDNYYNKTYPNAPIQKVKKFHRGMHPVPQSVTQTTPQQIESTGGFIIEVDQ